MSAAARAASGGGRARGVAAAIVAGLAALALWLRLSGLDHLLPHVMNRDGLKVVVQAELMRQGVWDGAGDPRWSQYPHLLARIVALLPACDAALQRTLAEHLACAGSTWLQARAVNAVAGALAVPATYALARHFLDRPRALLAAGLVATSLWHVEASIQERPHGLLTTAVLATALAAMRLARRPTAASCVLAGAGVTLAIGALHNGVAALPMIAVAWWRRARAQAGARLHVLLGILALALALAALFYPFALHGRRGPPAPAAPGTFVLWGKEIYLERFDGSGFARLVEPLWAMDPLLSVLAAAGLALGVVRLARRRPEERPGARTDLAIALGFCLPYLLVFGLYRETAGRYVLPLVPFLACLAAGALPARIGMACLAALAIPLVPAVHMALLRARPDTIELAAATLDARAAPDDVVVVTPSFDLPRFTADRQLAANAARSWRTIWSEYQSRLGDVPREGPRLALLVDPLRGRGHDAPPIADPLAEMRALGARWIVLEPGAHAGTGELHARLREQATRVERISPLAADTSEHPFVPYTITPSVWSWTPQAFALLGARALGPTLEVYRLE